VGMCGSDVSNDNSESGEACSPVNLAIHVREWTYVAPSWYVSLVTFVWKNESTGIITEDSLTCTADNSGILLKKGAYVSLIHKADPSDGTVFVRDTQVELVAGTWKRARMLTARSAINMFENPQQLSVQMHRPESIDNLATERSVSLDALQLLIVLTVGIARNYGHSPVYDYTGECAYTLEENKGSTHANNYDATGTVTDPVESIAACAAKCNAVTYNTCQTFTYLSTTNACWWQIRAAAFSTCQQKKTYRTYQKSVFFTQRYLMVPMYIPTRSELTSIDLQDVMFPSITDTISTYWERLYVTAGLQTHDAEQVASKCEYRIRVVPLHDSNDTPKPSPAKSMLSHVGCKLTIKPDGVGECVLEVPTWIRNDNGRVGLTAELALNQPERCMWPELDMFTATIQPYTMMHTCDINFFWSEDEGMCVTCDFTGGSIQVYVDTTTAALNSGNLVNSGTTAVNSGIDTGCESGEIVLGCLSLDYDTTVSACRNCSTYGRDVDTYDWITGVCQFKCNDEYYQYEQQCLACTDLTCSPGSEKTNCTAIADAKCTPCEPPNHGIYSSNIEYTDAACNYRCKLNYFRETPGAECRACKTLAQKKALKDAERGTGPTVFYEYDACDSENRDTRARECNAIQHGTIIADADELNQPCKLRCEAGYRVDATGRACSACAAPLTTRLQDSIGPENTLPEAAFHWTGPDCGEEYLCDHPYYNRSLANGGRECMYCGLSCATGQYRGGDECQMCIDCLHVILTGGDETTRSFTSPGTPSDNASCNEECADGHFQEFEFCLPYDTPQCVSGKTYEKIGTSTTDAICWPCTQCLNTPSVSEVEYTACTVIADTTCTSCPEPPANSQYTMVAGCATECEANAANTASGCELCVDCGNREFRESTTSCACSACPVLPTNASYSHDSGCVWGCSAGFYSSSRTCLPEEPNDPQEPEIQLQIDCSLDEYIDSGYQCRKCEDLGVKTPLDGENITWRWKLYGTAVCVFECINEHYEYSRVVDGSKFCYTADQYQAHVMLLTHAVPASLAHGFAVTAVPTPDAQVVTMPPTMIIALSTVVVLFLVFATLVL